MVRRRVLKPLPLFDAPALYAALDAHNIKQTHATALWSSALTTPPEASPSWDIPGLPSAARGIVQSQFAICTSDVSARTTSTDGSTIKLTISLQDGLLVESVIMHHDASAGRYAGGQRSGGPRATLCVSSQVGCQMACSFCATGSMGLQGDLTAGEIVEQLVHAMRITAIRNVVFMGMGEPLNNYSAVQAAVRLMMEPRAFGLSPNRITISTVGIIPRILSLPTDLPDVNLALSLHAPSQHQRAAIVPAAKAYPLDRLMEALDAYLAATNRSVLIEYVMLAGVNDSLQDAHQLALLLAGRKLVVNLIPFNPTEAGAQYQPSSESAVFQFQKVLREECGLHATVRQPMGQDIAGACGQLVINRTRSAEGDRSPMEGSRKGGIGRSGGGGHRPGGTVRGTADMEDLGRPVKEGQPGLVDR